MKKNTFLFIVTTALLLTSAAAQELPLFSKWMNDGGGNPLAVEMKRDDVRDLLWQAHQDTSKIITARAVVPVDAVTLLSPAGLRYIGEGGITVIPFADLPPLLAAVTGWTPEIEARYKSRRKDYAQMANTDIAIGRLEAAKAENRAWADQHRRTAPGAVAEVKPIVITPKAVNDGPGVPSSQGDVAAIIRANAASAWPGDYSMQAYVIKRQTEAWQKLQRHKADTGAVIGGIVAEAEKEWGTDYEMVCYVIKRQTEAWQKLQQHKAETGPVMRGIVADAEKQWGTDYEMVCYEIKVQCESLLEPSR